MRLRLLWLGIAAVISVACGRAQRPDVILVSIDTLRADALGCYGRRPSPTPHLDRLAVDSIRFSNAVTPVPVTLPAHASLFTALLPRRHGLRNNGMSGLAKGVVTLAQWLRSQGYQTAGFPSAAVLERRYGLTQGFGHYDDRWLAGNEQQFGIGERNGAEALQAAWAWWRSNAGHARFLWLHLFEPHAPYHPPPPFAARFSQQPYLGEVAAADALMGTLVKRLRAEGWPAVWIVVGDHGESLGEHGEATHGTLLYEATLRIPMLLQAPGEAPRTEDRLASLVDVFPTLSELIGLKPPAGVDGVDLLAATPSTQRSLVCESYLPELDYGWKPMLAVRQARFKLIGARPPEVYDLRSDPRELRDLAAQRRHLVDKLASELPADEGRFNVGVLTAEQRRQLQALGYSGGGERSNRPDAPDSRRQVHLLSHLDQAAESLTAGAWERAEAELLALLAADPGNREGLRMIARLYLDQGRPRDAERLLRRAIEQGDRSATLLTRLGMVLQDLGQASESDALLEEALTREPDNLEARIALGVGLAQRGQFDQAEQQLREAARLAPNHPVVLSNLAGVLVQEGRHAEAEVLFREVLQHQSERVSAWTGLGNSLRQQGKLQEALVAYQRAAQLAPQQAVTWHNLGRLSEELGRIADARMAYRRFLELAKGPSWQGTRREIQARLGALGP